MEVKDAIKKRRSLRSMAEFEVTDKMIKDLAESAQLAPSCFNKQPWQFVFVYDDSKLKEMSDVYSKGNEWAQKGSLVVAIISRKDDDCVIRDRVYHQFDTGLATGQMMLRATEMGLVTHLIAGYSPRKTKKVLNIPADMEVIALMIVGKETSHIDESLNDMQKEIEKKRPSRKEVNEFVHHNEW